MEWVQAGANSLSSVLPSQPGAAEGATANDRIELPAFLEGKVERALYVRWLGAKAQAHARRDFGRGHIEATRTNYRRLIHAAVVESEGLDFYTGEMLDWHLIGTYRNEASTNGKHAYKKTLNLLPTLDHHEAAATVAVFKICAWRTNDSKHDLSTADFIELSRRVLEHHGFTVTAPCKVR
jgi:hypothetical protein